VAVERDEDQSFGACLRAQYRLRAFGIRALQDLLAEWKRFKESEPIELL